MTRLDARTAILQSFGNRWRMFTCHCFYLQLIGHLRHGHRLTLKCPSDTGNKSKLENTNVLFSFFLLNSINIQICVYVMLCVYLKHIDVETTWQSFSRRENHCVLIESSLKFIHGDPISSNGHLVTTHSWKPQLDNSSSRNVGLVPDSNVHGINMGPTWVLSAPDGPHAGPMNLAIRVILKFSSSSRPYNQSIVYHKPFPSYTHHKMTHMPVDKWWLLM